MTLTVKRRQARIPEIPLASTMEFPDVNGEPHRVGQRNLGLRQHAQNSMAPARSRWCIGHTLWSGISGPFLAMSSVARGNTCDIPNISEFACQ